MSQTQGEKVREVSTRFEAEAKEAQDRAQRAQAVKSPPPAQQAAAETQKWMDWVDRRIDERFEQRVQHIESLLFDHPDGKCPPLLSVIGGMFGKERADRRDETAAAVAETKRWVEGKLEIEIAPKFETLEQRIAQHVGQSSGRADALGEAIAAERAARQKELDAAVDEAKLAVEVRLEAKLTAVEERLKALPGAEQQANNNVGPRSINASGASSKRWMGVSGPAHCRRPSARPS